jgi:processing peptidase subunit beta
MSKLVTSLRSVPSRLFEQAREFAPTQTTTLANGVRVATQQTPGAVTGSVGVFIDAGSRDERTDNNGAAHFLEHVNFKGTARRSQRQLEVEVENKGAALNAYTAREQTVYWVKTPALSTSEAAQTTSWAGDLLADILLQSKISAEAVEAEKGVILREMAEIDKTVEEVLLDKLHMAAFRDSSLGFTILGPEENVRAMTRDQLLKYKAEHYRGERIVVAGAGNVDHAALVKVAEETFGKLPRAGEAAAKVEGKPYFCGSQVVHRNDEMGSTAHVAVGYEGVSWRSPDALTFMVMQQLIGNYKRDAEHVVDPRISGNRTINNVANKMGVGCADSFAAFNTSYRDTGLFGWHGSCDQVAVEHMVGELMFGCTSLAYAVTDEEVQRAKRELLTNVFGNMNDSTVLMEDLGRQLLVYGRRMEPREFIARLDKIDAEEVKRVAWQKLHDAEIAVIGLGPTHGLLQHYEIRKHTQWFRY